VSTILNTNGSQLEIPAVSNPAEFHAVIVMAEWNSHITEALTAGAVDTFHKAGVPDENIEIIKVAGSVELVYAARLATRLPGVNAVITIGCVIRGDTPHFDYVCESVTQGVATINAEGTVPVIFGVLTVNEEQQAIDRAGGSLGNKGSEAAVAAIQMAELTKKLTARF
jgi:6,7-dimethyl-8-ribityllumazine synthase